MHRENNPYIVTKHRVDSGHYTVAVMTPIEGKPFKGVFVRPADDAAGNRPAGTFDKFE